MEAKDRAPDEINKEKMRQQQMEDEERHSKRVSTMVSTCASHTACCMTGGRAICKKSLCLEDGGDWYDGTTDTTVLYLEPMSSPSLNQCISCLWPSSQTQHAQLTNLLLILFLLLIECSNNQWEKEWTRATVGWSVVSWKA